MAYLLRPYRPKRRDGTYGREEPAVHPTVLKALGHLRRACMHYFCFDPQEMEESRRRAAAMELFKFGVLCQTVGALVLVRALVYHLCTQCLCVMRVHAGAFGCCFSSPPPARA
jgi:hypothetical protein